MKDPASWSMGIFQSAIDARKKYYGDDPSALTENEAVSTKKDATAPKPVALVSESSNALSR